MLFSEGRIFINMLKQFDIDYDKITVDGQVVKKPSYLSPSQWLSIWNYSSSQEYQEDLDKARQEGLEESENEHEKELEDLENQFFKQLDRLENRIESIFYNTEHSFSDTKDFIKKEFNEIRDIQWR